MKRRAINRTAIFAVMAILSSLAILSPNASASSSTSGQVLNYWLWQDNATDNTWANLADEFNAQNKSGQVKLQVIPLAQFQDKLVTSLSSGNGPDASRFKDSWLAPFVKAKALVPLSTRISGWSFRQDVISSSWNSGKVPGDSQVYMMPHQNVAIYMYYNKTLFSKAGLMPPKTQAEVLADAPRLTGNGQYAMDIRGGVGGQDQWAAWMFAGGAQFVDGDGKVTIDNAKAIEVNQRYLDLGKYAPPGSVTANFAQVKSNFLSGLTAMMIHHSGSLVEMRAKFGSNLGVIPVPSEDPTVPTTLQTMSGNVILASSKKQDLAWRWISWLLSRKAMLEMSTSPQGQLPVTNVVATNSAYTKEVGYKVAINAAKTARSWPHLVGTSTVVSATWAPTIQSAFLGQMTSAQAMQTLATTLAQK